MKPLSKTPGRLLYPDLLRVFAAFLIVGFHYQTTFFTTFPGAELPVFPFFYIWKINCGSFGVCLFMFLSGYTLWYRYRDYFDRKEFFKKRFFSVMLPFYLSYITFFIPFLLAGKATPKKLLTLPLTLVGLDGLLSPVIDTCYILGEWFLGMIVIYYLLFPILRKLMKTIPLLFFAFSIAVDAYLFLVPDAYAGPFTFNLWIPLYLPIFLFGILLQEGTVRINQMEKKKKTGLLTGCILTGIAICVAASVCKPSEIVLTDEILYSLYFTPGFVLALLGFCLLVPVEQIGILRTVVTFLASISWEMCLLHHILFSFLFHHFPVGSLSTPLYAAFYLAVLAGIIILSTVYHQAAKFLIKRISK